MKTRILTANTESIREAALVVKGGGLVVYPTDTVYGLGCDPFNIDAVERLIKAKGGRNKPLPILARSTGDVERVAELSEKAKELAERYWPGPLTLILQRKDLPDIVTLHSATVGVRIPKNQVALTLLMLSGGLLVGTSANKTGTRPPFTASEAYEHLKNDVDIVLDGGAAELKVSSTILDLTGEKPKVLRKGSLILEGL